MAKNRAIGALPLVAMSGLIVSTLLFPFFHSDPLPLLDLSKSRWQVCAPATLEEPCEPTPTLIPHHQANPPPVSPSGNLRYSIRFETPSQCLAPETNCALFIGEVGDAARLMLNGEELGRHGELPPKGVYSKHYPVNLRIPEALLKPTGTNLLVMISHSFKKAQAGIRKGPLGIYETHDAFLLNRKRISQNIIIPLISATLLFAVGLTIAFCIFFMRTQSRELRWLFRYSAATSLFLFSFTEIPREFMNIEIAGLLHFALRILSDFSYFTLIQTLFYTDRPVYGWVRRCYLAALFSFPAVFVYGTFFSPLPVNHFDAAHLITRMAVPLILLPHILALRGALTLGKSKIQSLLIAIFSLSLIAQINDALVFHGLLGGHYYVRIYPVLIAFGCGVLIFSRISKRMIERASRMRSDAMLGSISRQMAHDIRSPLAALELVAGTLSHLSEERRLLIRNAVNRIRNIAASLMAREENRWKARNPTNEKTMRSLPGAPLIEEIVFEKGFEFHNLPNLRFQLQFSDESLGLCARIDSDLFKRVLSNLINNAVESLPGGAGLILITGGKCGEDTVTLQIADTGMGMEPCLLRRIGRIGATFNKKGGTGLGLAHARETLREWSGTLQVESSPGKGTRIKLELPRSDPPSWWNASLEIDPRTLVVALDDEPSIHDLWRDRLKSRLGHPNQLKHFNSGHDFRRFFRDCFIGLENTIFLMDHELSASETTSGLDLIEECGIGAQSILVTSHFLEMTLHRRCEVLGVRLLPKSWVPRIPIRSPHPDFSLSEDPFIPIA